MDHAPKEHRSKRANSSPGQKTLLDHALLKYIYHSEARNLRLTDRQTDSVEAFYQSFPSAQLSPRVKTGFSIFQVSFLCRAIQMIFLSFTLRSSAAKSSFIWCDQNELGKM